MSAVPKRARELYTVPTKCHVCGKAFKARYNVVGRARVCTPASHRCRRATKNGRKIPCSVGCCRSGYQRGAASASMDNAIDPRKVLTGAEFNRTMGLSRKVPNPEGITIRFIAETGCRLGEALLVEPGHLQFLEGKLSIVRIPTLKRQGRPLRSVHLRNGTPFTKELRAWTKGAEAGEPLFPVARRTLQYALERILDKAKPDRASLVHILRHTRASQLVGAGASLNYVRQQLGWSSLELLRIYAHEGEDRILTVLSKLNDRERSVR